MHLRSLFSSDYLLRMRFSNNRLFLSAFFFAVVVAARGQVIDIGDAIREGPKPLPISVESSDAAVLNIARRAFELHGGYSLKAVVQPAYTFKIDPVSSSSVKLLVLSGKPTQELYSRNVSGSDLQNAVLRACDVAVEATLQTKGFFAGKLAYVRKQQGVSELYTSGLLFNKIKALTADRAHVTGPDWSPDGTKIVYTTYHKSGFPDIYLQDLNSNRRIAIADFNGTNASPEFSPNGQRIAMALSGKGNSNIFIADVNGKNLRPITRSRSIETSPSWSPDGRMLVLASDLPGKPQIYEVSASGGSMQRLPTNVSGNCSEPVWNPVDKNLIALTAAFSGGFQIVLYDRRLEKSEVLTRVPGSAVEPEWLNDGRHLVFTHKHNGKKRLMILDTKTKKVGALHRPDFGETSSATFVY